VPESEPVSQDARVDCPSVAPEGRYLSFSWSATRPEYAGRDIYEDFDLWRLKLIDLVLGPNGLPAPISTASAKARMRNCASSTTKPLRS
jgi:hypothetical protein